MTLTQTLQIKERFLNFEDMKAFDYVERRWKEEGCPGERWQVINFLEKMLHELKGQGGYPKVLLLRKKEIQRRTFTLQEPSRAQKQSECSECDPEGFTLAGKPCSCSKGDKGREKLRKWGMQI